MPETPRPSDHPVARGSPVLVDLGKWDGTEHREDSHLLGDDEFEEHQRLFGYPADVIAQAERDWADVLASVKDRAEPFADRPDRCLR